MIYDLNKILKQIEEQDEYTLTPKDMNHPLYWIWVATNTKLKDLESFLRSLRREHARFDIFINGQFILERDYIFEQVNNDFHVSFIKANFQYELENTDDIKLEGDIDSI